jgi:hypothetical protein
MTDTTGETSARYEYIADWQALDPAEGEAIGEFWRREGALTEEAHIKARLPQVVMHVRDNGRVAAISTAIAMTPPQFGQPVYYFRMFVGKEWRTTSLIKRLAVRATKVLEDYAAAHDFPCIGVMLELEGARFKDKWRMPIWNYAKFIYVGRSQRGLETRVYYFRDAMLKSVKT